MITSTEPTARAVVALETAAHNTRVIEAASPHKRLETVGSSVSADCEVHA